MLTIALLAILAIALSAIAVGTLLAAIGRPRTRMAARVDEVNAYGYAASAPAVELMLGAPSEGAVSTLADRLGALLSRHIGSVREEEMRRLLVGAGLYRTSVRTLLGYRLLGALALGWLCFLVAGSTVLQVALGGFGLFTGWVLSLTVVRRRGMERARQIELEVPNLIDQIVVTLEAGLGFSSSLQTCVGGLSGALGDEMRLTLQEQRMGVSLPESLNHLRDRVDSPNLKSFVRAVVQGERLGVSIGQVMRDLAIDMRKRRRQQAEERAQKTPVKLLMPVVFLILPTLFIVMLAPPLMNLAQGF